MTFLPIADRELRVAARRQFTYWSRVVAAASILLVFGMILMTVTISPGMGMSAGQIAFNALKWIAFVFACAAGIFLTSDSISEEKREGTLGLLFLTDLRGYDVVFGKLLSQSLLAFYCVVAAMPILALPLLMGGVTGAEFGRAMLVIGNTLFLSLAIGMLVSSISREVMKAMNAAALVTLLIILGLLWVDYGLAGWNTVKFKSIVSIASPGHLFYAESGLRPADFWFELMLQHAMAWGFLIISCLCVPRAWQEKTVSSKGLRQSLFGWFRFGSRRGRLKLRRKLLPKNPMLWIALRDHWMPRMVWLVMFLGAGLLGRGIYRHWYSSTHAMATGTAVTIDATYTVFIGLLSFALILWVASQACRLFVDAVRNGALELVLVTPLPQRRIIYGQWTALWRTFLVPLILLLLLTIMSDIVNLNETMKMMRQSWPKTGPAPPGNYLQNLEIQQIVSFISSVIGTIGSLMAMAWFGMWMGMTSRKTSVAVLKTICFVVVLPWFVEVFVQLGSMTLVAYLAPGLNPGNWPFWISTILAGLFELGKNLFFILWARHKLLGDLRETVARSGQRTVPRLPRSPLPRGVANSSPASP